MHPLVQQIRSVARRAKALVFYRGLAWCVCVILSVMFLAGWLDYFFRFSDQALRWLVSGTVLAVACACLMRFVWPGVWLRRSDTFFAQMIERRFPELQDRLSSAIAFLHETTADPRLGSPRLREAVVEDATSAISTIDLVDCLDSRATRRALWALLAIVIGVLAMCAADARSSILAAHRLIMPWKLDAWPRRNWLVFSMRPEKIAAGDEFVAELKDQRGWLPSEVTILYWFDGDPESAPHPHRMEYAGGKMIHRLPNVTRSFRYRAVGGDDQQMDWTHLRVVEAPRIVESNIRLRPPEYTGLPEESSERSVRGFMGTSVTFRARTSKPVSSATLVFAAGKNSRRDTAVVNGNGSMIQLPSETGQPWLISESGTYGWLLVDRDGVSQRTEPNSPVEVLRDQPPTVTLVQSPSDSYTSRGVVKLEALIKDDLAVQRISVFVNDVETRIFDLPNPPAISSTEVWPPLGEQRVVTHLVELDQLEKLTPGDSVRMRIVAADFKPQESIPTESTITIINPEQLKSKLAQQQSSLLERLQETLRLQQTISTQTKSLLRDVAANATALAATHENSQGLVLGQRRVREQLGGESGAISLVELALDELTSNQIEDPQLAEHLTFVRNELNRLSTSVVPSIEEQLEQAARLLRISSRQESPAKSGKKEVDSEWGGHLTEASKGQELVISSLEDLVDRLSHWSNYRSLAKDVDQIRNEEESLMREMQSLPTAARDVRQLSADEQAMLKRLADRQNDLATRMDRLHQRLDRMKEELGEADPTAAATIDQGLRMLDERSISSQMRDAAQQLTKNHVGTAMNNTEQIIEGLHDLQEAFGGSGQARNSAAERQQKARQLHLLVQSIAELASEQQQLAANSEELSRNMPVGEKPSDSQHEAEKKLLDRQNGLVERTGGLATQAEMLPTLSEALRGVASLMNRAAQRIEGRRLDSQTVQLQRTAANRLRQLAEAFQNDETKMPENGQANSQQQDSRQSTSPFGIQELRILRDWQVNVNAATQEIATARGDKRDLTDEQQKQLTDSADEQQLLVRLVQQLVAKAAGGKPAESAGPKDDEASPNRPPSPARDTNKPPPAKSKSSGELDDQLFNELSPRPPSPKTDSKESPKQFAEPKLPAGEDVGQPSRPELRMTEIGRQMQRSESLLRANDTSPSTRDVQQQIAAELSQMIDELKQQQGPSESSQQQAAKNPSPPSADKMNGTAQPNGTAAASAISSSTVGQKRVEQAREVWGTLPDHVQKRFNNLSDEQFLPEFEQVIREYYDRLSERGRKEP